MSTTQGASGEQRIFLRKASGLIRTAGTFDTFVYNTGLVSVGLGLVTMLYYGPAFYPGGNMILGSILAGVMMAAIAFGMICWSVTLPRSGGVYVFGTRILPPWLALMLSFGDIFPPLFYGAIAAYWIIILGVSPALAMIGFMSGSQGVQDLATAISSGWPLFLIGSGILILSGLLQASGMKRFLAVHKAVFVLVLLGSLIQVLVLLFGTHDEFVTNFNAIMAAPMGQTDPYNAIIASAAANGWTTAGADWTTTLGVSNWAFLPLVGAAYSIAIAGEIKSVERAQTFGMLGAVITATVLWVLTIWLAYQVFGYDFLGSVVYNVWTDPATAAAPVVAMPTEPSINLLSGIISQSWLITLVCSLGVILWIWMWIPGIHSYAVRAMVAWAFDRVAPDVLGTVSQKRHTPTVSIFVCAGIMIFFMGLLVFTESFSKIVILIEAQVIAWSVVLLAGMFFPYKRPHIYEKSPIARKRLFGLPLMTVACGLGFLASQFYFWSLWFDGVAAGHAPDQIPYVIGIFVLGLVFYLVMRAYRASQGIDINLAFKEIPIE